MRCLEPSTSFEQGKPRPAHAFEIETIVAERINTRFGPRFQGALEHISEDSTLLSKLPRGIPLFLRCRERLIFFRPKALGAERIDSISGKGRERSEEADQLHEEVTKETPFGLAKGNATLIWPKGEVRADEHYTRFFGFRAEVKPEVAERYATAELKDSAIVVSSGGAAYLCESGPLTAKNPITKVQLPEEWASYKLASLAWLKSSFFIWHCAVHLGDKNLYQQLQDPSVRIPFPKITQEEFYRRLSSLAQNIVIEEKRFLEEITRELRRGSNYTLREKLRNRHNSSMNALCLSVDNEISAMLSLSESETEFIARTLRDMNLSDFGFLEKLENQRKTDEEGDTQS